MSGIVQTLKQPVSMGLVVVCLLVALSVFFLSIARIESRNRQSQARLMAELYASGRGPSYRGGEYIGGAHDGGWLAWLLPLGLVGVVGFAAMLIIRQNSDTQDPAVASLDGPSLNTAPSSMIDNAPPAVNPSAAAPVPELQPGPPSGTPSPALQPAPAQPLMPVMPANVLPLENAPAVEDRPLTRRERALARRERRRAAREARMNGMGDDPSGERRPTEREIEDMLRWERERAARRRHEKRRRASAGQQQVAAAPQPTPAPASSSSAPDPAPRPAAAAKPKAKPKRSSDDDIDIDALLNEVKTTRRKKTVKLNQSGDPLGS